MLEDVLPKPPGSVVELAELALRVLSTLVNAALVICALYVPMIF